VKESGEIEGVTFASVLQTTRQRVLNVAPNSPYEDGSARGTVDERRREYREAAAANMVRYARHKKISMCDALIDALAVGQVEKSHPMVDGIIQAGAERHFRPGRSYRNPALELLLGAEGLKNALLDRPRDSHGETRNDLVFLSALQIRYPRLPEEKLNTAARLFDMTGHAADRGVVASRESRCAVAAFAGHALDECALWLDRPAQSRTQDRDSR